MSQMVPEPGISEEEMASQYGLALSLLKSNPVLNDLFNSAVRETWTPEKFTAQLRNSSWYKENAESVRSAMTLKAMDPATYAQRVAQTNESLMVTARSMGAQLSSQQLNGLADQAFTFGWSNEQVQAQLRQYIGYSSADNSLTGQAAQSENAIRRHARAQGINVPEATIMNWVRKAAIDGNPISAQEAIDKMAESAFPHLSDRLAGGETLEDISAAYRASMAKTLELNPDQVDVFDPTVRSALAGVGTDGKPAMKSLWQFERDLRKDERWRKTQGAQDSAMATTRQILKDMGVAGLS